MVESSMESQMDVLEHICPITFEPIKKYGMTCYGNIYEYDAIKEWFESNDTDPINNLMCPNKFVMLLRSNKEKDIFLAQENAKHNFKYTYPEFHTFRECKLNYEKLKSIYDMINESDDWINYNVIKKQKFIDEEFDGMIYYGGCENVLEKLDENDIMNRPDNTGAGYQFIKLSEISIKNKGYKSFKFEFVDFTNSLFINCDFSRCTFIGCKLDGVVFAKCRFIGEQNCFYKSTTNKTKFFNCCIEPIGKWIEIHSSHNRFRDILKERQLDVENIIILC